MKQRSQLKQTIEDFMQQLQHKPGEQSSAPDERPDSKRQPASKCIDPKTGWIVPTQEGYEMYCYHKLPAIIKTKPGSIEAMKQYLDLEWADTSDYTRKCFNGYAKYFRELPATLPPEECEAVTEEQGGKDEWEEVAKDVAEEVAEGDGEEMKDGEAGLGVQVKEKIAKQEVEEEEKSARRAIISKRILPIKDESYKLPKK
jgi:hypothetical protein